MCEVEELRDNIERLLVGRLTKIEGIGGIEPNFIFIFYPKYDIRSDYQYATPGYEIKDISMDLQINYIIGGLTDNRIIVNFKQDDLEILLYYLNVITRKIKKSNKRVQELGSPK